MDSTPNNFTTDQLHVAQQSRREKLRVQLCSPSRSGHRVDDDYTSSFEIHSSFNPADLVQVGDDTRSNILYHPVGGSSEMLNFNGTVCINSRNGAMEGTAPDAVNSVDLVSSNLDGLLKSRVENNLENCGVWQSVRGNYYEDNWNSDLGGRHKKKSSLGIVSDISASEIRAKENTTRYRESEFQYGDMNFATQFHYPNALSNGVTTAVIGLQPNCNVRRSSGTSWGSYGGGNEHVCNVPYGYQPDVSWNTDLISPHSRTNQLVVDSQSQGLSLSLCSYPAGSMITESQFGNSRTPQSIPLHNVASIAFQDSKPCNPNDNRMVGLGQGNSLQESLGVPSTNYYRQTGPLGPFTGYATILKSSKFLRPAQQLLDECCGVIGKLARGSTTAEPESDIGFDDLATAVNSMFSDALATGDFKGVSSATKQDSDELMKGATDSPRESLRPDYQAKKAKLLYMLEELSRRYKQYYQQMQMVVSAFESVAGLADATPYISSALKTVSQHFNHIKNAISNQLRHIMSFLGKDFSLPPSRIRDKGNFSKRLKCTDDSYQKYKSGGSNMGLLEPQQHIWRPQRGLPERAVSVLRAWLFEHFLHPYPTDTDKHMLATQTGLTRNQVSNWFINARVRLWKPMVEEVHMLETKGVAERNRNAAEDENISANVVGAHLKPDHSSNKMIGSSVASVNLEYPAASAMYEMGDDFVSNQHDQEKLSRVESKMSSIDKGMLGISRYHQNGNEISGIGPISLTLGLRQSADQLYRLEGSQHQPYLQQQDRMRHLGTSATHEYAG